MTLELDDLVYKIIEMLDHREAQRVTEPGYVDCLLEML